jgi:hypothetical protein
MSIIRNLVARNGLKPADVIVVRRAGFAILDHYMVFMGYDQNGNPLFMANMKGRGITYLRAWEIEQWTGDYRIDRIRRFEGNHWQRNQALARAKKSYGQSYSLFSQNCEHFANHVQYSEAYSRQSRNAGWGAAALLAVGLFGLFGGFSGSDED